MTERLKIRTHRPAVPAAASSPAPTDTTAPSTEATASSAATSQA